MLDIKTRKREPASCCRRRRRPNSFQHSHQLLLGSSLRRRHCCSLPVKTLLCTIVLLLSALVSSQTETCAPPSSNLYEWEDYNYYQILDLAPYDASHTNTSRRHRQRERSRIKSSDVRKAYRKQAQLFHPDKVKSNANTTLTVEESNARFARIAEAYKVLSDEVQRQEYDHYLLECEDRLAEQKKGISSSLEGNSRAWSLFADSDPRRVFEEFFFGSAAPSSWDDVFEHDAGYAGGKQQSTSSVRMSETREVRYDPYRGTDVLRVTQTEEHAPDSTGRSYVRVTAQEFVEQFDRRHGGWVYVPIGPPVVIDEGYYVQQQSAGNRNPHASRDGPDVLWPGQVLTPGPDALLTSANERYYAGLSPQCELVIMADASRLGPDAEDTVLWSSQTYVPPSHLHRAGGCFLAMSGPHLVLALGTPSRPGTVLWYSGDVSEAVAAEEERIRSSGGPAPKYFARLDNDGSLAVYSQWTVPPPHEDTTDFFGFDDKRKPWWSKILNPQAGRVPTTRAARAWVRVREWTHRRILSRAARRKAEPRIREVCLFATGPAGCNSPGRKVLHIANDMGQSVRYTMTRMDNAIENFVESLGSDEDEDILDTLLRILSKAGSGIGRAGHRLAKRGARAVRAVIRDRL